MFRTWALLILIAVSANRCIADTITVNWDGTGDYTTIQAGIDVAVYGDTVDVAAGTYVENITLKDGVAVIGAGPVDTTIDGNQNGSVVTSVSCGPDTLLDGFTITNGTGTIDGDRSFGGGVYNYLNSSPKVNNCAFNNNSAYLGGAFFIDENSSPVLTDCSFTNNYATVGGGMYIYDECTPVLTKCTFTNNSSIAPGGAMHIGWKCASVLTDCTFTNNSCSSGGAVFLISSGSIFVNCTFTGNQANANGGAMTLEGIYDFDIIIITCTFTENSAAEKGGAIYNDFGDDRITIANCYFKNNEAASGGAVYDDGQISKISSCVFTQNTALENGGALECIYGPIENCIFTENIAGDYGGALYYCNDTISNCIIEDNSAGGGYIGNYTYIGGGGLARCSGTIENCSITGNTAIYGGGLSGCSGTIINCEISNNTADTDYGGLGFCHGFIIKCTITGNSSDYYGGGLGNCDAAVIKCIIKGNSSMHGGGLFWCEGVVTSCIIADNTATSHGGGLCSFIGTINNCLIVRNSSDNWGGGLFDCHDTLRNSTIAGNTAVYGGGLYGCNGTITNCIISGNSTQLDSCSIPTYSCIENWTGEGRGNIDEPPLFVDAANDDYHLRQDSPCINAGDPNFVPEEDETDIDEQKRIMGGRVDMGADEVFTDDKLITVAPDGSGDYLNIQDAIDVALEGDKIIVAKGTYFENINFNGKDIILSSTDPDDWNVVSETTIDGGGIDSVVTFGGTVSPECVLTGFTITGGHKVFGGGGITGSDICNATVSKCIITNNEGYYGGGLFWCDGTISNCIIEYNTGDYGGGLFECSGTIIGCTIKNNVAWNNGGGLAYCDGKIINCTIENNTVYDSYYSEGGGLSSCNGIIDGCIIKDNVAGFGGGLRFCTGTIQNCEITCNTATHAGGGFYEPYGSINNCTIAGNTSYNKSGTGGGIYYYRGGPITNCIFWSNEPEDIAISFDSTIDPIISYCNIEDGWRAGGNISVDPNFVNEADGDYHLRWNSPCIDAGFIVGTHTFDIDGEPRVMGSRIDIGADEVGPKQADFTRDGIINIDDFSVLSSSWQTTPTDENWYILSDLWQDSLIGLDDIAVFIQDWLWEADWH